VVNFIFEFEFVCWFLKDLCLCINLCFFFEMILNLLPFLVENINKLRDFPARANAETMNDIVKIVFEKLPSIKLLLL